VVSIRGRRDDQGKGAYPMNTTEIRNALKARLAQGVTIDAAFPNVSRSSGGLPYLQTSFASIDRSGDAVKAGDILEETGQFNIVVVVEQDTGEDVALDFADMIADLFPQGLVIPTATGSVAITAPTIIRNGFPTDRDYRVPTSTRYHALRT